MGAGEGDDGLVSREVDLRDEEYVLAYHGFSGRILKQYEAAE